MDLLKNIEGALNNDRKCQRELYMRYAPALLTVSKRYTNSTSDAKDILQETFIKIFKYLHQYDSKRGSFEGWTRTITVRTALRKSAQKKPMVELENSNLPIIDNEVVASLSANDLLKLIQDLPDIYRQVFNLNIIEGYSHREIAEMMNIKESSSRARLNRARALLQKKIMNNEISLKAI